MVGSVEDRRIRALRGPKVGVDPWQEPRSILDRERRPGGRVEQALTVFLTGAECPFTCLFCDLWRYTLDQPTPPGALPSQLEATLRRHRSVALDRVKLYNASNFFEQSAVPREDLDALATAVARFPAVTVETHARTVGAPTAEFAARIGGRLEVAIGLESVHPDVLPRLNKKMTVADFDRAAAFLLERGIELRAFVLVGAPFLTGPEAVDWAVRTATHAIEAGAAVVALIPARGGNGAMDRLRDRGEFVPPTLTALEDALDRCLELGPGVVTADLWDLDRLTSCALCASSRAARLARLGLTGRPEPRVRCDACG